jgi:hypothetical protein
VRLILKRQNAAQLFTIIPPTEISVINEVSDFFISPARVRASRMVWCVFLGEGNANGGSLISLTSPTVGSVRVQQ